MIGIEVFAGAGGMSHGAEAAGVNVRAATEITKAACATFADNHPHTHVINSDMAKVDRIEIGRTDAPVILFGGPPVKVSRLRTKGPAIRKIKTTGFSLSFLECPTLLIRTGS